MSSGITIKRKVLVTAFIMASVAAITSATANYGIKGLSTSLEKKAVMASAIKNSAEGDMMHDAIRGDVLLAIKASREGNFNQIGEAEKDLTEHAEVFREKIRANEQLPLSGAIKQTLNEAKDLVESYIIQAQAIINIAKQNGDAGGHFGEFMNVFSQLEERLGKNSELIEEAVKKENEESEKFSSKITLIVHILSFISITLIALLPFNLISWLFKPLERMIEAMVGLSEGNRNVDIKGTERKDEIGRIAKALQVFKENGIKMDALAKEQEEQKKRAEEEKRRNMHAIADSFENSVKGVVDMVASAATEMDSTSQSVSKIAGDSKNKLSSLVGGIESATINVQSVSSATHELSASVSDIAKQVSRAASITLSAVKEAERADETVKSLDESAKKISEVVMLINEIAEQINLLALNATIEAARAGEAGKGFAVVASEVKNLATQTSKATEEISSYINSIQGRTTDTVNVIKGITGTIREINGISTNIASAVEEQSAVTADIAKNVEQAASSTKNVSGEASSVAMAAEETENASGQMQIAASELSKQAEKLRHEVEKFLQTIRA